MYFWLKVLHIGAMAVWFAGLFFLPRLFVVQQRGEIDADRAYFNPAANLLFFRIMTPAALITTVLGMVLMAWNPDGAWLVMKLVLVTVAVLVHLYLGVLLYRLGQGHHRPGPWLYRALGWTPLVLLLAIAALTGAKPDTVGDLPPPPSRASLTPPGGPGSGQTPIRLSTGMSRSLCSLRIMPMVSPRLPLSTSYTRLGWPIDGTRSFTVRPPCSMRNLMASTGSGDSMGKCFASYASTSVARISKRSPSGEPGSGSLSK